MVIKKYCECIDLNEDFFEQIDYKFGGLLVFLLTLKIS